ncbi:nectin 1a-like [Athene noctua]|uniref:nectin 1a-like n=1 Tax=Athene noctua TaxID=126797 RepID=UPI003EBE1EB5
MGLKEAVKADSVITAALGGEANFCCNFSSSVEVLQVTWQKRNGSSFQNIATYSTNHGPKLIGSFQKKVRFTTASLKASAITIQNLTFEDESCYRCIFNVFPHGSVSADICLNIQTISELTVEHVSHLPTKGLFTAVCSATGKPAPKITWVEDRDLDESSEIRHVQNANGTVNVGLFFFPRLKRCPALRTPAKEKGLHQDLSEKVMSLHTPKDQNVVYQNEKQTPGSSLHKRLPGLKRNPRKTKYCRHLFSEEAENLKNKVHGISERGPVGLCVEEPGCTPLKEDRETTAGGTVQITRDPGWSPAQERKERHHPAKDPPSQAQRSTGAQGQVGTSNS